MTKLQLLYASEKCGIDQVGIGDLNLVELIAHNNSKITNVSYMTKLRVLGAVGTSGIDQAGIQGLALIDIDARHNSKITR